MVKSKSYNKAVNLIKLHYTGTILFEVAKDKAFEQATYNYRLRGLHQGEFWKNVINNISLIKFNEIKKLN